MELILHTNAWGRMFGVPTAVVDQYLKLATPSQLKVLLYLLRHVEETIQPAQLAAELNLSPDLIEEAMLFWSQTSLFDVLPDKQPALAAEPEAATPEAAAPSPTAATDPPAAAAANPPERTVVAAVQRSSAEVTLTPSEIVGCLQKNESLSTLFRLAEQQLGRLLTHTEQRSLLWQHDYLGISSDVILTVLAYCISIQKVSVRYAENLILNWWNQDLTSSMQRINDAIVETETRRQFHGMVAKRLHLIHPPTTKQREFLDQWQALGIPIELIAYAQEKAIEGTDHSSFPYMHKILLAWSKAGYKTRAEVDQFDVPPEKSAASAKNQGNFKKKKNDVIPESPMADAYRSLIYNMDE